MGLKAVFALLLLIGGFCASPLTVEAATVSSARNGNWSNSNTWTGTTLPNAGDTVIINSGHTVIYDVAEATLSGVEIQDNGTLRFIPSKSAKLVSDNRNVIVRGKLEMKPQSAQITHMLKFINVNEDAFVGGGMVPLDTDVGLWVVEGGVLDIQGTPKTSWTRLDLKVNEGSALKGDTKITIEASSHNWRVGDEISIVPTGYSNVTDFDVRKIVEINGREITLDQGLSFDHPSVAVSSSKTMTAEVLNLTRNVMIEGSEPQSYKPRAVGVNISGRSHILIHNNNSAIHKINYATIRYMGPRQYNADKRHSESVVGRYGLHFHMSNENNRSSLVEGTVVRDTGTHAFVPHTSHGITFKSTISYHTFDDAYWWDPRECHNGTLRDCFQHVTNDIVYDGVVAALVDNEGPEFVRLTGFNLQTGQRSVVRNSVTVGLNGGKDASGFLWPEGAGDAVWGFENNVAHNNSSDGIFIWQNDDQPHVISNFVAYHNGDHGIEHGAYSNAYLFENVTLYRNGTLNGRNGSDILMHATSRENETVDGVKVGSLTYKNITIDSAQSSDSALSITFHNAEARNRGKFINWHVKGYKSPYAVTMDESDNKEKPSLYDFICWKVGEEERDLEPSDFNIIHMTAGGETRVQRRDGTAFMITPGNVVTQISSFETCPQEGTLGDLNNDQKVTIQDALLFVSRLFSNTTIFAADVNQDTRTNLLDLLMLIGLVV